MQDAFNRLVDALVAGLSADEVLICSYGGEDSEFVRFNHGAVRQAGSVRQQRVGLDLIRGAQHAVASVTLSGEHAVDLARLKKVVDGLRERLPHLPEDPYLNYATEVRSSEARAENVLPDPGAALDEIRGAAGDKDLVGIYASGVIEAGLANSLGQRNWYDTRSFNLDWSFFHAGDKAVKTAYAGFDWDPAAFGRKVETAARQLEALKRTPRTIEPGRYRVYLAPAAIHDIVGVMSWGGFGLKALKTRQSPLLKLSEGEVALHPSVSLRENTAEGIAPDFQGAGFIRPPSVTLIEGGMHAGSLISPRSAKEYGVSTNGASAAEMPESIEVGAGGLPEATALERLDTGIWIGNVWYLNYSDRSACRTTGMTRFATFWVENGEIVAPLNVMRFDESVFRMLGGNLVDLTAEREFVLNPGSWGGRQTSSGRVPGALVEDFNLTL